MSNRMAARMAFLLAHAGDRASSSTGGSAASAGRPSASSPSPSPRERVSGTAVFSCSMQLRGESHQLGRRHPAAPINEKIWALRHNIVTFPPWGAIAPGD